MKEFIAILDSDIATLTKLLHEKKELRDHYVKRFQELCSHNSVMRVKEEGDDHSHTECVICGAWNPH